MRRRDLLFMALIVVGIVASLGYWAYVAANCNGEVVRGFFDQPVCVAGGGR